MSTFQLKFALESYLINLTSQKVYQNVEFKEGLFKENVYYFSVDCVAIDISEISNIHKYLMIKNNMK